MVNEAGPPPPPPTGAEASPPDPNTPPTGAGGMPPPGGDPLSGLGGMGGGGGGGGLGGGLGDPMGGGGGGEAPRAAINVTTVWDALKGVLGKNADRQEGVIKPHHKNQEKEPTKKKSLIQ